MGDAEDGDSGDGDESERETATGGTGSDPDPDSDSDPDPFAQALYDFHRGEQDAPLYQRDGQEVCEHPVEDFYFGDAGGDRMEWIEACVDGPLVDLGAGVGRDALYLQERMETVAVEVSDPLVRAMRERGVRDARRADMFALRETFERDRFRTALSYGTQICLSGSPGGLRRFLGDLSFVTGPDATAVVDGYDPDGEGASEMLGYRADPLPGLAGRVMQFEYEGRLGPTLRFRLFSPRRLREAAVGTGWRIADVRYGDGYHYLAALEKR